MNTSFANKPAETPEISHRGSQSSFFGAANPLPNMDAPAFTEKERVDILYLDEEPALREIMGAYFRRHGLSVITATSAELAMRLPDEWQVAVIVLDASVADRDGGQLVRFLRASHPATPIILRTAPTTPAALEIAFVRRGATRCIATSEPPAVLLCAVLELRAF